MRIKPNKHYYPWNIPIWISHHHQGGTSSSSIEEFHKSSLFIIISPRPTIRAPEDCLPAAFCNIDIVSSPCWRYRFRYLKTYMVPLTVPGQKQDPVFHVLGCFPVQLVYSLLEFTPFRFLQAAAIHIPLSHALDPKIPNFQLKIIQETKVARNLPLGNWSVGSISIYFVQASTYIIKWAIIRLRQILRKEPNDIRVLYTRPFVRRHSSPGYIAKNYWSQTGKGNRWWAGDQHFKRGMNEGQANEGIRSDGFVNGTIKSARTMGIYTRQRYNPAWCCKHGSIWPAATWPRLCPLPVTGSRLAHLTCSTSEYPSMHGFDIIRGRRAVVICK